MLLFHRSLKKTRLQVRAFSAFLCFGDLSSAFSGFCWKFSIYFNYFLEFKTIFFSLLLLVML